MVAALKNLIRKNSVTAVDENTVTSSDGWRLQSLGHSPGTWKLLYSEGEKNLNIPTEPGTGGSRGYFHYVYLSDVSGWQTPHEREPFAANDRKRIAKNIRSGLSYLKRDCKIV